MTNLMRIYYNTPVEMDRDFFKDLENLYYNIKSIDDNNHKKALNQLSNDIETSLNRIIQQLMRRLNRMYNRANEYRDGAKAIYGLIDMNLRHYKKNRINQKKGDMISNTLSDDISSVQINNLKEGYLSLVNSIIGSLKETNNSFESKEDLEDELVWMVDFAYNLEISLRPFAKSTMINREGQQTPIDYYDRIEQETHKQALENIQNQEEKSRVVQEAESEMEKRFEQLEG